MSDYRVPMNDDQFQAVLEAALATEDLFIKDKLIALALSYKNSIDHKLEWRMEDEK